uniref:transketolase n=1 Tax=Macrostomum lignano TaxID=282301 RepID=A0A1I8IBV8_9PLAT
DPERRPLVLVNPSDSPDEQQEAIEEPNNVAQRSPVTVLAQHPSPLYKLLGYFTILFTFALSVIASLNQAQEDSSKHEDASEKSDNSSHHGSLSTAEMFSLWMESLLLLGGIGAFIYLTFRVILDKTIDRAELVNPYDPNNRLPEIGAVHWCLKMPHHLANYPTTFLELILIVFSFLGLIGVLLEFVEHLIGGHASGAALAALTVKCILLMAFVPIQVRFFVVHSKVCLLWKLKQTFLAFSLIISANISCWCFHTKSEIGEVFVLKRSDWCPDSKIHRASVKDVIKSLVESLGPFLSEFFLMGAILSCSVMSNAGRWVKVFLRKQLSGRPVDEIKRSISEDYQVSLVDRILAGRIRNLHPRLADIGAWLLIICNAAEWFIYGSAFSLILGYRNDDPVNLSLAIVTLPLHVFFYFHSIGCLYDFKEHPTSCASMAEIMSVLFFHTMKYSVKEPKLYTNDRFILSKGHAAPILYAAWAEAGLFPASELLNLRKISSDLEGHPTPRLSFVDVATGSLGQGLSFAAGMAHAGKHMDKLSYRVFCVIGDGESAEGSIWEAAAFAAHYRLDNLVAILDVNRLGQSDPTPLQHSAEVYKARMEAFGWHAIVLDGHNVEQLVAGFDEASRVKDKPSCIVAVTFKGKGFIGVEDQLDYHGKPLGAKTDSALANIRDALSGPAPGLCPAMPTESAPAPLDAGGEEAALRLSRPPGYKLGEQVATRLAYGNALVKLGEASRRVVALDGDTKNSTFSLKFAQAFPDRFIECFIAEQNMVGVAVGIAARRRRVVFVSTFAAFLTRTFDQLRMAAISQTDANFAGSHAGVSIGEDGPSQMALEDLAMFRSLPGSTVFYPSDAVSAERAVELAANTSGICFIRTGRPNQPVLYGDDTAFAVGKGHLVRQSEADKVCGAAELLTIVGAGVTITEALAAADQLAKRGIAVRVVDPFTVKPIDAELLRQSAAATGNRVLTVEDHYPEGGLGEAVAASLPGVPVRRLAVGAVPRSGKSQELLAMFGIDSEAI